MCGERKGPREARAWVRGVGCFWQCDPDFRGASGPASGEGQPRALALRMTMRVGARSRVPVTSSCGRSALARRADERVGCGAFSRICLEDRVTSWPSRTCWLVMPMERELRMLSLLRVTLRPWASCLLERVISLLAIFDAGLLAGLAAGAAALAAFTLVALLMALGRPACARAGPAGAVRGCTAGVATADLSRIALLALVMKRRRELVGEAAADGDFARMACGLACCGGVLEDFASCVGLVVLAFDATALAACLAGDLSALRAWASSARTRVLWAS